MVNASIVQQLMPIAIFRGLSQSEVSELSDISSELKVERDRFLFREGDPGDALYIVLKGQIRILKHDRKGQSQELANIGDGGVLGEMSLLNDHAARSASAQAITEVSLLKLPSQKFSKLLAANSIPAHKVVMNLAQVMSRRLLLMDEKLVELLENGRKREELVEFQRILRNWSF
jgi:CRP-like cAMP-binding protein